MLNHSLLLCLVVLDGGYHQVSGKRANLTTNPRGSKLFSMHLSLKRSSFWKISLLGKLFLLMKTHHSQGAFVSSWLFGCWEWIQDMRGRRRVSCTLVDVIVIYFGVTYMLILYTITLCTCLTYIQLSSYSKDIKILKLPQTHNTKTDNIACSVRKQQSFIAHMDLEFTNLVRRILVTCMLLIKKKILKWFYFHMWVDL